MKRWLPFLLAIVVIAGMCVFFLIRRNTSDEPQNVDEEQTQAPTKAEEEKKDDGSFYGLQINLPEDYRKTESADTYVRYSNGTYDVRVQYAENTQEDTAQTLWEAQNSEFEAHFLDGEYLQHGSGITQETPYAYAISMDESQVTVKTFYATPASVWIVEVTNPEKIENYELDPMILLIAGWTYSDPKC